MSSPRIAVIEDDVSLAQILKEKLTREGFLVVQAFDGEEGFVLVKDEMPSLVLLDIVMPKMDGLVMLQRMRDEEWGKDIPVILLTNLYPDDKIIKAIDRYNPAFYLVKSEWRIENIIEKIKEVLHM